MGTPATPDEEAIRLKSEERRALVLLGVTAVAATVWAALWTKSTAPQDYPWNFPLNSPFKHLTIFSIPALQILVEIFLLYAFFVFWYFCVDWFPGRKGIIFREACHVIAIAILGFYIVAFIAFLPGAEISFFLPDSWQPYYWLGLEALFILLEANVARFAVHQSDRVGRWVDKADMVIAGVFKFLGSAMIEGIKEIGSAIADGFEWLIKKVRRKG